MSKCIHEVQTVDCLQIVFATALVRVFLPRSLIFDQKYMRKPLHDCLQQGILSAFSATEQRRTALLANLKTVDSIHVVCIGRLQSSIIQC